MKDITKRFLTYISKNTQSIPNATPQPSSIRQFEFLEVLRYELTLLDIETVMTRNAYLYARIRSNIKEELPILGFMAHIDTSPDCPGKNIKPQIIENYNGDDIVLNKDLNIVLSPQVFPELRNYIGQTLITTDGTTLLGADDKAGIAAIVEAIKYFVEHPEIPHPEIRFAFTPDEEVGRGTENLDMHLFNVKYAYTIDGGEIGELEFENFNAADATLHINGTNIHPGYAKGKMINANTVAMEIDSMLPKNERPETTEGYEGFYHLTNMEGKVEKATVKYIIRDHDKAKFQQRKDTMLDIVKTINDKYGNSTVDIEIKDSYCNMREIVEPQYHIVEKAIQAMKDSGVEPKIRAIRGGTDGAWLSYKGIPCPNIFAGGHNFHSRYEYLPVESMEKAAEVIIRLITLYGQESNTQQ